MEDFLPFMTGDYSVGLYSSEANDIFHSVFGALTEAYEKFVEPIINIELLNNKKEIKVLDICYGIGYNSKILMNEIIKNKFNTKIIINCVDNNSDLIKIAPFIKSKINFIDRILYKKYLNKNILKYKNKIISHVNYNSNSEIKIDKNINKIILKYVLDKYKIEEVLNLVNKIYSQKENHVFFDADLIKILKKISKIRLYLYQKQNKSTYLHNIYYRNISDCNKFYKYQDLFRLNFYDTDARSYIRADSGIYDVIFLDGFTPLKCPSMWTKEFIKKIYDCLSDDGVLLTYNTSAVVRSTFIKTGFYVGRLLKNDKEIGTIVSKNSLYIKNKFDDKYIGLLNTKAGIPFRDEKLDLNNDMILYNREEEVKSSSLESSSSYLKRVRI